MSVVGEPCHKLIKLNTGFLQAPEGTNPGVLKLIRTNAGLVGSVVMIGSDNCIDPIRQTYFERFYSLHEN